MKKISVLLGGIAAVNVFSFYPRNLLHNSRRHNFPAPKIPLTYYSVHEMEENHELQQRKNASSTTEYRNNQRVAVSLTDMVEEVGKAMTQALPYEKRRSIRKVREEEHRAEKELTAIKPQSAVARSQGYVEDELVPDTNPRVSTRHL